MRAIIVLVLAIILLISGSVMTQAASDDDYKAEYSVLYAGDNNDSDAARVAYLLDVYGWSEYMYGTSRLNQVRWWSVTGEDPDHPYEYSDNADFLYYSTHGSSNSESASKRQHTSIYYGTTLMDILDANQADYNSAKHIVGSGWRSYPTQSYSRWDNDLEWAVIAACNQIEYEMISSDGAHDYGKALLGYPRRMHSIWGYHDGAPLDPADEYIAEWFVRYTEDPYYGRWSVRNAWEKANERNNEYDWSGVYHQYNVGEAMWSPLYDSSGNNVLADTSNTSSPDIRFVMNEPVTYYVTW